MNLRLQYTLMFVLATFIIACHTTLKEKKEKPETKEQSTEDIALKKVMSNYNEPDEPSLNEDSKTIKQLTTLTPLSDQQFQDWIPKSILNMPLERINLNAPPNVAMCDITYEKGERDFRIHIVDGAGEHGAKRIADAFEIADQNEDKQIPMGYVKTVKENGIVARERYAQVNEQYKIRFFYNNRMSVTVTSHQLTRDEVWKAIKEAALNDLL